MARPPQKSKQDKVRIVLAVLRGELAIAEAARREAPSQTSVAKWRDQFLSGGEQALEEGARHGLSGREQVLAAEVEQLTAALGEAHCLTDDGNGNLTTATSVTATPVCTA